MAGTDRTMSATLQGLEGRISEADYNAWADLETARVLQRYLIEKLGENIPDHTFTPPAG